MIEEEVLAWLTNKVGSDEVEDVTDEILDKLIARVPHLAVLFCESHWQQFSSGTRKIKAPIGN